MDLMECVFFPFFFFHVNSPSAEYEEKEKARIPCPPVTYVGCANKIAILVMCYNRKEYLKKTIESIRKYIPLDNFAAVISQDGDADGMSDFIKKTFPYVYGPFFFIVFVIAHPFLVILYIFSIILELDMSPRNFRRGDFKIIIGFLGILSGL